jgi:hypothetical protein
MTTVTQSVQGLVKAVEGTRVVFNPLNTTYELHLTLSGEAPATGAVVRASITLRARKVWTMPSGGNFVTPIIGEPRVIQGRMRQASQREATVHAGFPVTVELPQEAACYDLANGPVGAGALVNMTVYPGATFSVLR